MKEKLYILLATTFVASAIFAVFVMLACVLQMVLPWMQ